MRAPRRRWWWWRWLAVAVVGGGGGGGGGGRGGAGGGGGKIEAVPPVVTAIDHVQLAMPAGCEAAAESFYCGVLGLEVREKPPVLARRGGRWFGRGDVQVHLGVEEDFRPARKAHPALCVTEFDELLSSLDAHGVPWRPDVDLPGARRVYVDDPFGNRLELIDAGDSVRDE